MGRQRNEYGSRRVEPAVPRPAATVILLRRGGKHAERGLEVLLVQRNPRPASCPGVWVFPGGAVEPADGEGEEAHRAAAVRELAEEAAIEVPADELVAYSRWITPKVVPIRFDTRFYLALAPAHSPPQPDGSETVDAGWFDPQEALERHHAGELPLVFPTIKHLESLVGLRERHRGAGGGAAPRGEAGRAAGRRRGRRAADRPAGRALLSRARIPADDRAHCPRRCATRSSASSPASSPRSTPAGSRSPGR